MNSFNAFEEVLQNALEFKADLLILGGDLFHEKEPS
jgi:DNA repair exonuclease SbcCD nuclease subunit